MNKPKVPPSSPPFRVVIDTREQRPFKFEGIESVVATLKTGDYSIQGLEDKVAVERKSYADAWGSMSAGRARFERCVKRLAELDRAAIVIECGLEQLAVPPHRIQQVTPASVIGGLISWSCQYAIPVYFAGNAVFAERVTLRFLAAYYKHRSGLYIAKGNNEHK